MSLDDPENGCVEGGEGIKWGKGERLEKLNNSGSFYPLVREGDRAFKNELKMNDWGQILFTDCTDLSTSYGSPIEYPFLPELNLHADYNTIDTELGGYIPYQFDELGNKNPLFTEASVTVDADGSINTGIIVGKDDESSAPYVYDSTYPAASVCYLFNAGVSSLSGKWYLPAIGELTYVWANISKINEKISRINKIDAIPIGMGNSQEYPWSSLGYRLISSSQAGYDGIWCWFLETNSGNLRSESKGMTWGNRVRAFIQI